MSKILVPACSRKDIENFAVNVRKEFGLENTLYVPVLPIIEKILPVIDATFSYPIIEKAKMPNEYANYSPETNQLMIREDVYDAIYNNDPRHRFTLAHELGHYFMHNNIATFSRCSDNDWVPIYRDAEWQANVFASAFLMPPDKISKMTISEIADKCGTSRKASEIAYKNSKKESSHHTQLF